MNKKAPPIPSEGFMRLSEILKVIPISPATWWRKVKNDHSWPQPIKLGHNITVWRSEEIKNLIREISSGEESTRV